MVEKIVRWHGYHLVNVASIARTLLGWMIALAGVVIMALQWGGLTDLPLRQALHGGAMSAAATMLGAVPVLFLRNITRKQHDALMGFGAGVMLAASFFSLLEPAFDGALRLGYGQQGAAWRIALSLCVGAAGLLLLDRLLPHRHEVGPNANTTGVWLFVLAIAVHNVPEGLAIGVAATSQVTAQAVATGISLQNIPEGLVVAVVLVAAGYSRWVAMWIAAATGLVEPIFAIFGFALVATSAALVPWGLAFAAGAMLFVVSHEIIPRSHRNGNETWATGGLLLGFVLMLLLDAAFAEASQAVV